MMNLEMVVEVLEIVKREKNAKFEALDKKYEEFFKDEFLLSADPRKVCHAYFDWFGSHWNESEEKAGFKDCDRNCHSDDVGIADDFLFTDMAEGGREFNHSKDTSRSESVSNDVCSAVIFGSRDSPDGSGFYLQTDAAENG